MSPLWNASAMKRAICTRDFFLSAQGVHNNSTLWPHSRAWRFHLCRDQCRGPASQFLGRFSVRVHVSELPCLPKSAFFSAFSVFSNSQLISAAGFYCGRALAYLCRAVVAFNLWLIYHCCLKILLHVCAFFLRTLECCCCEHVLYNVAQDIN